LLEYAMMSHIPIITNFLSTHPRSRINPRLTGEISFYLASIRAFRTLPPATQPFLKVMYGTNVKLLRQEDVRTLWYVALEENRSGNPTLARFAAIPAAVTEHALYRQWRTDQIDRDDQAVIDAVGQGLPVAVIDPADRY